MTKRSLLAFAAAFAGSLAIALQAGPARTEGPAPNGPRLPVIVHRGSSLPPPGQSKPVPLLVALHESGGSPYGFESGTGLDAVADQNGFVVAYLSSSTPTRPGWAGGQADIDYISSEIRQLTAQQNIDPNRVYVTGFSAGATMTFLVGCQLSSLVDGIASVSGAMRFTDTCQLTHPVSQLLVIGTTDAIPIDGTSVLLSADQVAAHWRGLNGCTAQSSPSTAGAVTTTTWNTCNDGSGVGLVVISAGTHQWPGPHASGADSQYDAAQSVWAFFAAHPGTSASKVTATVSSVAVRRAGHKRSVLVALNVPEARVTLGATLKGPKHALVQKAWVLPRTAGAHVVIPVPAAAAGGRYSLTLSLSDSYGRRSQVVRSVVLPA